MTTHCWSVHHLTLTFPLPTPCCWCSYSNANWLRCEKSTLTFDTSLTSYFCSSCLEENSLIEVWVQRKSCFFVLFISSWSEMRSLISSTQNLASLCGKGRPQQLYCPCWLNPAGYKDLDQQVDSNFLSLTSLLVSTFSLSPSLALKINPCWTGTKDNKDYSEGRHRGQMWTRTWPKGDEPWLHSFWLGLVLRPEKKKEETPNFFSCDFSVRAVNARLTMKHFSATSCFICSSISDL